MLADEEQIKEALRENPGNELFAEYAHRLTIERRFGEALVVCLRGLSVRPQFDRGRMALARVYFEMGFLPFAIQELKGLSTRYPQNSAVRELLTILKGETAL